MEDKKLADLLPEFHKQYGLGTDGGQSSPFVRIELSKKIILYFPNFKARKIAVLKHDIHHIVTGYRSTFKGETEIGAWEIGSGCRKYWAAWILDISSVMTGILFNPWKIVKAYARGRRTKNLYHHIISDEEALQMKLGEIQHALYLDKFTADTRPGLTDLLLFLLLALAGLLFSVVSLALLPFILAYTLYIKISTDRLIPTRSP
jgi:hypothetical protein